MPAPNPINVVLCESWTYANDTLATREGWIRTSPGRWTFEGEEYRIITQPNHLRGHRLDQVVQLGGISEDLFWMAHERLMENQNVQHP